MRLKIITKDGPRRLNQELPVTFTKFDLYRLRNKEITIWISSHIYFRGTLRLLKVYPPHPVSSKREVIFILSLYGRETDRAEITFTYDHIQKCVDDGFGSELYLSIRSY